MFKYLIKKIPKTDDILIMIPDIFHFFYLVLMGLTFALNLFAFLRNISNFCWVNKNSC